MAVAVSQTGTATHNAGAATENFTFTTASGDTLAVFFIQQDNAGSNAISSVTWDSGGTNQACTLIGTRALSTNTNGSISAYAVVNPTVGTKTLAVVQALGQGMAAQMQSYTGTNTTSVANACTNLLTNAGTTVGTNTNQGTVAQTGVTGDLYVSGYCVNGTVNSVSDTSICNLLSTRTIAANSFASAGATHQLTAQVAATSTQWAAVSFDISQPVVVLPFNQLDWSKGATFLDAASSSPAAAPFNVALYTGIGAATQVRGGVYTPPFRMKGAPPDPAAYNSALYAVTVGAPFAQLNWPIPRAVRSATLPDVPYNQALYTVVVTAAPFIPVDFQQPRKPLPATPLDVQFNPNLFTNPIPILNVHYVPARQLRAAAPPDVAYNQPLYTVTVAGTPFIPVDFGQVRKPAAAAPLDPGYNQSLYAIVVTGSPFVPVDFSRVFFPQVRPAPADSLNPNLFTNPYPFSQVDFARPRPIVGLPTAPQAYLQTLYSVTVTLAPFVQVDGAKAAGMPRSAVNPYASANYTIRMPTGTVTPQLHARPFIGSNFGWKPF